MYDVSEYTDSELYTILDINNPTDRELEAKILSYIHKYRTIGNEQGKELAQFFVDIYNHFFDDGGIGGDADEPLTEGLENKFANPQNVNAVIPTESNVGLTRTLEFSRDNLNPLLKETTKRVISIDSQYRDNKSITNPSEFTFNLSEPLKDVVSLKLYSVQIPYTWYTVSNSYGGNFFYIKGVSPGITNGNYDHKIEIPAGNYTPESLATNINASISTYAATRTDVSFGNTEVIYNGRQSSSGGGTGKAEITVDIKQVFNESNYYVRFPDVTSTIDENSRRKSIASFLGYKTTEYGVGSVVSGSHPYTIEDRTFTSPKTIDITANDLSFSIISYSTPNLDDYKSTYMSDTITVHNTFPISIPLTSGVNTVNGFANKIDTALKQNPNFDANYTGFKAVNYPDVSQCYFDLKVKLKNTVAPVIPNTKLAVVFGDGPNNFFYGALSKFKFLSAFGEFSDVLSEDALKQSSYPLKGENKLVFTCDVSGYIYPLNNYSFTIPSDTYSLATYISEINTQLGSNADCKQSSINFPDNYLYLNMSINKIFKNNCYKITSGLSDDKPANTLNSLFGLPDYNTFENIKSGAYNNPDFQFTTVSFTANDIITFTPISGNGVNESQTMTVEFKNDITYFSVDSLVNYITSVFQTTTFTTTLKNGNIVVRKPFEKCYVTYNPDTKFSLFINIELTFTQTDYLLEMTSDMSANNISTNSWKEYLKFDSSNITHSGETLNFNIKTDATYNGTYSFIRNTKKMADNTIELSGTTKNYFDLVPYSTIDALNPSTRDYDIRIDLSEGTWTSYDIITMINDRFNKHPLTSGSTISAISKTDSTDKYIKFRLNINKLFKTEDYQIVFYDPISFVSCYSGATRRGNTSITNATWDTTVGWILGFRNQIIYLLSDYMDSSVSSNLCKITGDTAVNTNLYNYFLIILDDYVQNHLNDGLVTITNQQTNIAPDSYVYVCDPTTNAKIARPADYLSRSPPYTAKQLYSFNQQVLSQKAINKSYSNGPFVKDIFGIVPMKVSTMKINEVYVEFGGTLQIQERVYFGPVNIHRMTIKLLNDRGDLVDLNNADWSFSLLCEQLYKSSI
jgi:hypothetical protein